MLKAIATLWALVATIYGLITLVQYHPVATGWLLAFGCILGIIWVRKEMH